MLSAEVLSGNLTCDTFFYSKNVPVHKISYRIYYDNETSNEHLDAVGQDQGSKGEPIE